MKKIIHYLFIISLVLAGLLAVNTSKVHAATYEKGCYITSQGSNYQKVSCPNSGPDDAVKYANKCWVATASSQGQSAFKEFDCATGNQTDAQKRAACEASGGQWVFTGTPDHGTSSCGNCPTGKQPSTTVCQNSASTGSDPEVATGGGGTGANNNSGLDDKLKTGDEDPANGSVCGKGTNTVTVSFDFGCLGSSYSGAELNPILDVAYAIFRFLSAGVGLLVIGSVIIAGIQYSASRGNPQATQASIKRITNAIIGLLIYIFMFAILNFIVPGGLFL
jgi:hypothetical protein